MKPEEAIEALNEILDVLGCSHYSNSREYIAVDTAIQALEKQIPQKPQLEADGYDDGKLIYDTWLCPKCGEDYEIDYHDYKYCPECGQRIDWEETP